MPEQHITSFNKDSCSVVSHRILELVRAPLEREFGISVDAGGGTYDVSGSEYTCRIKMRVSGGNQKKWDQYCRELNLLPEHFGQEFTNLPGEVFIIEGIQPGRNKAILARKKANRKLYQFDAALVRRRFGRLYDWEEGK
jgi:hypothetical protein